MNAKLFVFISSFFIGLTLSSQNIGINSTGANAHTSALLDVDAAPSNDRGLLVPRIPLTAINASAPVTSPATSLLVYNTASASTGTNAVSPGYYYWDGVKWVRFAYTPSGSSSEAWTLFGNSGTNSTTNFIGTTDAQDLVLKRNNIFSGLLSTSNTAFGVNAFNPTSTGLSNTAIGTNALKLNAGGGFNVAIGTSALSTNSVGSGNTALGYNALSANISGASNVAIGFQSLTNNDMGDQNVAIGNRSINTLTNSIGNVGVGNAVLSTFTSGNYNVALGYYAGATNSLIIAGNHNVFVGANSNSSANNLTNATAIGYNSKVGQSNALILGGTGADAVNVGINTINPAFKLHVVDGQFAQTTSTNTSHSIFMGNSTGRNWQLYHLGSLDANAPNGFMFEHFDGSVWQRRVTIDQTGNVGIGALSPTTKLHVVSTTSNTAFRMQDGTEGLGKVLRSDASGNASWSEPAGLANYPYQSIGTLPVGASCPVGGTYSTSTIALPAGIYIFQHYSCAGQIGQLVTGLNVFIGIVSGSGDASGTWHDFNGGSCGHYYTGVLRCFTPCTVNRIYQSYSGSSFTVPGANSEGTTFIKIL